MLFLTTMPFYATLVENFFANECDPKRLDEIRAALDVGDPPPSQEFGGNVWTANVDFQNGVVTIEDDLDPSETGSQRLTMEEFSEILDQWRERSR